jgi:phosphohistidine phosphatase
MARLILFRHAKTERLNPGGRDADRRLTDRGRDDAVQAGRYLVAQDLIPDQVLVSTARRAQETWALASQAFSAPPAVTTEPRIYEASVEALFAVIQDAPDTARTLMLVGHNPGLHDLSLLLAGGGGIAARARLRDGLPTAGLVVIDFPGAGWRWHALMPHGGRLERFAAPDGVRS